MPTQKPSEIDQKFLEDIRRVSAPEPEPKKKPSERIEEIENSNNGGYINAIIMYLDESQEEER